MLTTASGPRGVLGWAKSPGQIAVTYLRIALISTTHMYWAPVVWLLMLGSGRVGMNEGGPRPSRRSLGSGRDWPMEAVVGCPALTCSLQGLISTHVPPPPPPRPMPPWTVAWNRGVERRKNFDCRQKWKAGHRACLWFVSISLALEGCYGILQVEEEGR